MSNVTTMTGRQLPPEMFRVEEYERELPDDAIRRLLDGELAGVLLREALSEDRRLAIAERFWKDIERERREGAAEGSIVGAYHYGHSTDEYLDDVEDTNETVAAVLGGENPVEDITALIGDAIRPLGQEIRIASHGPRIAAQARVASWSTSGSYLLLPHEDVAQLSHPDLADMEISTLFDQPLTAINVYPELPDRGGFLRVWNIDPDDEARSQYGTLNSGYYYPESALDGFEQLEAAPQAGSLMMLNARLIHAVVGYEDTDLAARRLSINFLVGRLADGTVIYWA